MSHPPETLETSNHDPDTISLLDGLEVVLKHKRLIIRTTLAAFILSIVVSLLLPIIYSSTARIIPPQQNSGVMGLMMGQLPEGLSSLAGNLLGKGTPADLYVGMLSSEAISDAIIDRFKLMDVYEEETRIDTYKALDKNVDISAGKKDGIVSITVEDKDPKRATDMANAYVEELDKLSVKLDITAAGYDRAFLEARLIKAKADLANAEEGLKVFQLKSKALDLTEQAKGTIKGLGDLEGQLALEEVKLGGMKRVFTDSSQAVKDQQEVVTNLRGQIAKFEGMRNADAIPGIGSVPELSQQYLRLMREFKIQEALVEFLTKQYEITALTLEKDVAGVQIIQMAREPDKKAKPKRSLIVLVSTFLAGFLSLFYAFVVEGGAKMSEKDLQQWRRIKSLLYDKKY